MAKTTGPNLLGIHKEMLEAGKDTRAESLVGGAAQAFAVNIAEQEKAEAEMEKQEVDGLSESAENEARWGYKMQGGGPEQPELPGLEEEDLMQKIKDEIKEPAPEDLKTVKGWYTRKFLEDVGGGGWLGLWAGLPAAAIGAVTGGAGLAALAGAGVVALGAGIGYILGGWLKKPANAKSIHWKALEMTHSSEYDRRYQKQKERSQRSPYGK